MKKTIVGIVILSVMLFTGCSKEEKKETTLETKVEKLESEVKELKTETSSSAEGQIDKTDEEILNSIKYEQNKKILKAFLDSDLKVYNGNAVGVSESEGSSNDDGSNKTLNVMYFQSDNKEPQIYFNIYNFDNLEKLNTFYKELETGEFEYLLAKNEHALSVMSVEKTDSSTQETFNKYKEVFESIK